jgi:hydroxymethylbilane synthase
VTSLRIGTRRSKLALAQVEEVRRLLAVHDVGVEVVPMTTSGDEGAAAADSPQGLKGLWIDTILDALESGDIDVAVHSAKDLPAEDDEGFVIAAVPRRAEPWDVLVTREPGALPAGAAIGTSALRRRAQLLAGFPGVTVQDLRGNVDTRLRKVEEGEVDAAVLAAAGLARLGVSPANATPLPLAVMVPAPGQGCLALQCRGEDEAAREALAPLDDAESHAALDAERSVMWRLGGGCALPLGAYAEPIDGGLRVTAVIAMPDGSEILRVERSAETPEGVAALVAKDLIDGGAERILDEARVP